MLRLKDLANGNTCPKLAPNSVTVVLPNLTVVNKASLSSSAWSASAPKAFNADVKMSAAPAADVTPPTANFIDCSKTNALSEALLKPADIISY